MLIESVFRTYHIFCCIFDKNEQDIYEQTKHFAVTCAYDVVFFLVVVVATRKFTINCLQRNLLIECFRCYILPF